MAFIGERDVGRCATHVETDRIGKAAQAGDVAAGDGAGGNTGAGKAGGKILDARRRHDAAAAVQQQQIAGVTLAGKSLAEAARVADNDRAQDRIGDRRGEPLVLEDLGKHL